ncbi:restriction endonuclease subunit S [Rheinheimera sp.]|uniref:restriction endonuclease subunit S n=1 Tax=Rheinheimera sp. TaxID=1869214 RepID=UPI004047A172
MTAEVKRMAVQVEQLITEHLDLWTQAQTAKSTSGRGSNNKIELTGIKKLRELILELAVRGKLVPQDPNDEPASELLKRIAAEKEALVKAGKLKKQKPLPPITDAQIPFELPIGWELARFGDAVEVINGRAYKRHEMLDKGMPLLRVGNLFTSNEWYYSDLELEENKYIDNGDLIYAWSASFGPFIWNGGKVIYHYHIWKLDIFDRQSLAKEYLYNYLAAATEKIKASGNGIAMIHMTKERMEQLILPIPPVNEQNRIAERVAQLMALCDQLEQQSYQQLDAHKQLVDALLATLNQSQNADELASKWQRLAAHFDTLFTTEYSIDALKQTILQLAVMGKLVKQDPNDEPASELLKRIAAEKDALVKAGKIKKQKPLPPIGDDEKPFELPEGWAYVRLNELGCFSGGKTPSKAKAEYWTGSIPWVSPKDMKSKMINDSEDHVSESALADGLELLPAESILIVVRSGILRRTLPVAITKVDCTINQDIKALRLHNPDMAEYVFLLLSGFEKFILSELTKTGTTVESVKVEEFINQGFILPPKSEQERIISKVNQLMLICDSMNRKLEANKYTQAVLAEALVEQVVA